MKKSFSFLLLISLLILNSDQLAFSQGTAALRILSMPGFPDLPSDSAYEGQSYTFNIEVANNSNSIVQTELEIVLKTDTFETVIFSDLQPFISSGDTVIFTVNGYNFEQTKYQVGNNIVVVWPRLMQQPIILVDTFYTNVFFIPLNSLGDGIPDFNDLTLNAYPIPAVDFISFEGFQNKTFEYVRIYNEAGQLVLDEMKPEENKFYIGNLGAGIYFVEAGLGEKRYLSKIIKQ